MSQGTADALEEAGFAVAIIGASGRFPGAENLDAFWRNLRDGVESVHFFTDDELLAAGIPRPALADPSYVKAASMLDDVESFDARYFGVSPAEAELLDPQQRIFLETVSAALEDAGYDPERYRDLIGVYGGSRLNTYLAHLYSEPRITGSVSDFQILISNDKDHLATRVSYKLNLEGPSVTVQTACSTSLVAVHLACQGLLSGECDLAVAGGVAVRLPPRAGYRFARGEIFSADGHTRTFDASSTGTLFGSGVGTVVLKRLGEAVDDGDVIRAVIRGSAINNDGSRKVGYTAPRPDGQAKVIEAALEMAEVSPETIRYVEAHGTGTPLGDPIEIAALSRVFTAATAKKQYCAIGSVKSNVGHLETAAGIAGLLKAVLALEHRQIPPSLHFERPNPEIDFAASPFYVNTELAPWPAGDGPRRAGVSAFGIGGTNAHVVLEEAPELPPSGPSRRWQLLLLSAVTEPALDAVTARLGEHLERHPELPLADVAHTLQLGRRALANRRAVLLRDGEDAAAALAEPPPKRVWGGACEPGEGALAFLFPGQGAQVAGMGMGLYDSEPVFRQELDRCAELLRPHLGGDLRRLLRGGSADDAAQLAETQVSQPALFAVEYALARLWMSWGVAPAALLGHSVGEYVAACLAGTLRLEDALVLVVLRGRLMQQQPRGSMLSVPLGESDLAGRLADDLSLAAVNGPGRCVVAGPDAAVEAFRGRLREEGVRCRRLRTSHAFHSPMMERVVEPFVARVAACALRPPEIPFLSNVTGRFITAAEATDPAYWGRHLRQPVRFADALEELWRDPDRVLLEVGPGRTLSTLARRHPALPPGRPVVSSLPAAVDARPEDEQVLAALAQLWTAGLEIDWQGFYDAERRRRVALPTYPFERQRYWVDLRLRPDDGPSATAPESPPPAAEAPVRELADWFYLPVWKQSMAPLPAPVAALPEVAGGWLVLLDEGELGAALVERLRASGQRVVTVTPGAAFAHRGKDDFTLVAGQREGYRELLAALSAEGGVPARVLHLWSLDLVEEARPATEQSGRSFDSLLYLTQAYGDARVEGPVRFDVVASGLWSVAGEGELTPEKALLLGPARAIPQEYPGWSSRVLEVAPQGVPAAALADQVLAELMSEDAEPEVVYRGAQRWVRGYQAVRLDDRGDAAGRLRQEGVYLLTGGLGGIGLALAEYLVAAVAARLILVGRAGLPEPAEWDAWLAEHGEGDPMGRKIRRVRALEEAGGEVLVLAADVADEARMREVVRLGVERFGALHGVIHGAGVPGGGVIQRKEPAAAAAVLAPKVAGTRALAAAVAGQALDFFILQSSAIALVGGSGQVDYCAANAFLDAFAQAQNRAGGPFTLSINWDAWNQVGMAVRAAGAGETAGEEPAIRPAGSAAAVDGEHPLLGGCQEATTEPEELVAGRSSGATYRARWRAADLWVLAEHRILGEPVLPGVAYLEMARAAVAAHGAGHGGEPGVELRDVVFQEPLRVAAGEEREVRSELLREGEDFTFAVTSRPAVVEAAAPWQEHARLRVAPLATAGRELDLAALGLLESPAEAWTQVRSPGAAVEWGAHWREIRWRVPGAGWAVLQLPAGRAAELESFGLHPSLLDVAMAGGALGLGEGLFLPVGIRRLRIWGSLPATVYVKYEPRQDAAAGTVSFDVTLVDPAGRELVAAEGFTLRRLAAEAGPEEPAPAAAGLAQGIPTREGVEAFARLLGQATVAQMVVSARRIDDVLEALARRRAPQAAEAAGKRHARPALATPYTAPRNEIERTIAAVWQEVLGFEQVGIHDDFFELGGDSILSVRLLIRLRETLQVDLSLRAGFEAPTVAEMAEEVLRSLSETLPDDDLEEALAAVEQLSDEEVLALAQVEEAGFDD